MGEMAVLDRLKGDTKVIWDADHEEEVEAARAQFDTLTGKGYAAFRVNARGRKGEQIREFDSEAEKIILAPQMVGG
jgi:hypothetical protein